MAAGPSTKNAMMATQIRVTVAHLIASLNLITLALVTSMNCQCVRNKVKHFVATTGLTRVRHVMMGTHCREMGAVRHVRRSQGMIAQRIVNRRIYFVWRRFVVTILFHQAKNVMMATQRMVMVVTINVI